MAKQWIFPINVVGNVTANRADILYTEAGAFTVGASEIGIYIGDNVPVSRALEIFNGWRWLYQGVLDRVLLSGQFRGAPLFTGSNINYLSEADRRTASDAATAALGPDDVALAMGADVTALGALQSYYGYFQILRQYALEEQLNAANFPPITGTETGTIVNASGDWSVPAVLELSGKSVWEKGTQIVLTGSTSAGPYGLDVTLEKDYYPESLALAFAEFLKGWNQSTTSSVVSPVDDSVARVQLIAAFGGVLVTFDSLTITPA